MSRMIPSAERITRARGLIQKARKLPLPADGGKYNFSYIAQVKDLLQQARDLVKFVQFMPNAAPETKSEVEQLMLEITAAEKEILHKS